MAGTSGVSGGVSGKLFLGLSLLLTGTVLVSCSSGEPAQSFPAQLSPSPLPGLSQSVGNAAIVSGTAREPASDAYRLGAGDSIRLSVYGEKDMSGVFTVSGNGDVSLPLVGTVRAAGQTLAGFDRALMARLRQYIKNPRTSSEVTNYRPYYIHGELKKSGEYPYSSGLTVKNAIARAHGYSYRAVTSHVYIRRGQQATARKYSLDRTVRVHPGDNILVPERMF